MRDHKWTRIYRLYEKPELYDRANEQLKTTNLAGRAENAGLVRGFREQIFEWLCETSNVIPRKEVPRFLRLEPS